MFEKMKVENFQIHESTQIEFDDITVFTGPTDTGKSSLIRALIWLCMNDAESSFIRDDQNSAKVMLRVDGQTVKRIKDKKSNKYQIGNQEAHRAVGTKVPIAVQRILNVVPDNFQEQHDLHFWFSKTPGQVAKELNAIVDLSMIDNCMATHKKMISKAAREYEAAKTRRYDARKKMDELKWGRGAEVAINNIERLIEKLELLKTKYEQLDGLISEIEEESGDIAVNKAEIGEFGRHALRVLRSKEKLDSLIESLNGLTMVAKSVANHRAEIKEMQSDREDIKAELDSLTEKGCPLCHQPLPSSSLISI